MDDRIAIVNDVPQAIVLSGSLAHHCCFGPLVTLFIIVMDHIYFKDQNQQQSLSEQQRACLDIFLQS
jgi:hypothetical protein